MRRPRDGVELAPAGGLVERLRAVKDDGELRGHARRRASRRRRLRASCARRASRGGPSARSRARSSRFLEDGGADEVSFPPIVAAGAHGALPHAEPRDVEIPRGTLVVLDLGARVDGYCSDCTRTFATGPLDERRARATRWCGRAGGGARGGARRGGLQGGRRARARASSGRGLGIGFDHGLGHGVGLEVHESPRLARTAEGALEAGNTVTVEPGLYVPGEFGIRIEDLVAVTERGVRGPDRVPEGARHRRRLMALAAVAAFVGAFVQSTTGFGFALLLSPVHVRRDGPGRGGSDAARAGAGAQRDGAVRAGPAGARGLAAADADADRGGAWPGAGCRGADAALQGGAPGRGRSGGDRGGRVAAAPAAQGADRPSCRRWPGWRRGS